MKTGFQRPSDSNVSVLVDIGDPYPGRQEIIHYYNYLNPAFQIPSLKSWGGDNYGQLGTNSTGNVSVPSPVGALSNWRMVSAGGLHAAAVKTDGTLWCWGDNDYGQLGDGTTTTRSSPVQIGTLNTWQQVSSGYTHTVAIKNDGTMWAWGSNRYGQLGFSVTSTATQVILTSGTTYTLPENWSSNYNVAVYGSGGSGGTYPLGYNRGGGGGGGGGFAYTTDIGVSLIPKQTVNINVGDTWFVSSTALRATAGTAGGNGSGSNGTGGTGGTGSGTAATITWSGGNGANAGSGTPISTAGGGGGGGAGPTSNGSAAVGVTGGSSGGGLSGQGGTAISGNPGAGGAYGGGGAGAGGGQGFNFVPYNNPSVLGGSGGGGAIIINYIPLPLVSTPVQVGTATNWQQVSAGGYHTMAIDTSGQLWGWGCNSNSQVGYSTASNAPVPTPTQISDPPTTWISVSCGWLHTLGINTNGELYSWGQNTYGQLGLNDVINRDAPTKVGTATTWRYISTKGASSASIKNDGSLFTWGANYQTNLGLGDFANRSSPVQVGQLKNWASISMGLYNGAGIRNDGSLWTWGYNQSGELGSGISGASNYYTTPVQVGQLTNWKSVSVGGNPIDILYPLNGNTNISVQGFTVAVVSATDF